MDGIGCGLGGWGDVGEQIEVLFGDPSSGDVGHSICFTSALVKVEAKFDDTDAGVRRMREVAGSVEVLDGHLLWIDLDGYIKAVTSDL